MALPTLLDIAKLNGNDKVVGLIEENLTYAPELTFFPSRTIRGTQYKTVTRTGFASGGFRAVNDGHTASKSTFVNKLVECYVFGGVIQADKAYGQAYEDGPEAWEMIESNSIVKDAVIKLGKQVWYGTSTDALGFPGIKAAVPFGSALCVSATGSTSNIQSSVYAVKFGTQDVSLIAGQGGQMSLTPFRDQQITGVNGGVMPGRVSDMTAWLGLQIGNINCVGRICNLDATQKLTDLLLADLINAFPIGYVPDRIFMSRRSRTQLQKSRTVALFGQGSVRPNQSLIAPLPDNYDGIPITATDSILNTDAVET